MVHRKSEYRLQYHFLPENIRKQIWEDNVNLRSCRKLVNQAHHYWEYQITDTDQCDCDGEEEEDPGPPPPHKLKHKTLLAQYGNKYLTNSKSSVNFDEQSRIREIAVQTPNWKSRKNNGSDSGRESGSSEELQDVMKNMSSLSLPEVSQKGPSGSYRPPSPVPPPSPAVIGKAVPRCRSRSHSRPSSVSQQRSTPPPRSRTPCPTRTTKKLHTEGKKTHFLPFGWNHAETDVGKKKTFNVCAPEKEPTGNPSSLWMSEYKDQFCRHRPTSASYSLS
ncbi:uncharacterized protein LOC142325486 isoform X2 [Lycorma delicatula]|uniref:uncharacterized protein LOC142325486 isoform X2 n=1 Tax=Lycorma delicatula TaxID=130591 RepID=UPI003F519E4E